jgi:hypothetical protein
LICLDDGTPVAMARWNTSPATSAISAPAMQTSQKQLRSCTASTSTVLVTTLDHQTMRPLPRR